MNKSEFEEKYCHESNITIEEYDESQITLPCHCDDEHCQGWAAVSNNELSIKNHLKLYA